MSDLAKSLSGSREEKAPGTKLAALLAPLNEVFWFMPGGGVIPKLAK